MCNKYINNSSGQMVELVYTYVLGTYLARGLGSSPSLPTTTSLSNTTSFKKCCIRCCINDKVLHCRKGMYRETAASKRNTGLRN